MLAQQKDLAFWRVTYSQKSFSVLSFMKNYSFNARLLTESNERGNSPISRVLLGYHYSPGIPVPHLPPLQSATVALDKSHLFALCLLFVPLYCIHVSLTPGKDFGKRYLQAETGMAFSKTAMVLSKA